MEVRPDMNASRLLLTLCALLALSLAACGSDDDAKKDTAKAEEKAEAKENKTYKNKIADAEPICPQVAVVRGLDVVQDYGNENPDPAQLVSAAKLLGVDGDCEYTDDGIDVAFHLNMVAKRGPRLGGLHTNFPFFVAVLNPDGDILNKNQMTVEFSFSSEESTANRAEDLHVFIPLPKDKKMTGPYYRVLAGFQLSPAQADEVKAAITKP
jgi:hypothetical protein